MPHEYRVDTMREELKSEYQDEIRELEEQEEDSIEDQIAKGELPEWASGVPSLEDQIALQTWGVDQDVDPLDKGLRKNSYYPFTSQQAKDEYYASELPF